MDGVASKETVLLGHSLGALISLAFTALHPERVNGLILLDGAGKLTPEQTAKILTGIRPFVDRLGQIFPDFDTYLSHLRQTPFMQPWNAFVENYFRYDVEEIGGGVRSRVRPDHIAEEIKNFGKVDTSTFYAHVLCPTLILRATEGMLSGDDLVLPRDVADRMVKEIPDSMLVDLEDTNHYSILFQPNEKRDRTILKFLENI